MQLLIYCKPVWMEVMVGEDFILIYLILNIYRLFLKYGLVQEGRLPAHTQNITNKVHIIFNR